jgi:mRNA interferase HigB
MRIISRRRLREFWERHPSARLPLLHWWKVASKAVWNSFADVQSTFASADQLRVNQRWIVVFNIAGNNYRLVAAIHYDRGKVFVREVMTHAEYSREAWKDRI